MNNVLCLWRTSQWLPLLKNLAASIFRLQTKLLWWHLLQVGIFIRIKRHIVSSSGFFSSFSVAGAYFLAANLLLLLLCGCRQNPESCLARQASLQLQGTLSDVYPAHKAPGLAVGMAASALNLNGLGVMNRYKDFDKNQLFLQVLLLWLVRNC